MKRYLRKRLHLNRETLRDLDLGRVAAANGGATTTITGADPYQCCNTITAPVMVASSACQTATQRCDCSTGQG